MPHKPHSARPGTYGDSKAKGLPTYRGKPCNACGNTLRTTNNGHCVNCTNIANHEREESIRLNREARERYEAERRAHIPEAFRQRWVTHHESMEILRDPTRAEKAMAGVDYKSDDYGGKL